MSDGLRVFICPNCGELSKSNVYGEVSMYLPESGPPAEFALVQCSHKSCQHPIVQVREDYGQGFDDDEPGIFYPSPRRLNWTVPEALRDEFSEARKCFDAKAYRATVVMVRRTLEGTCKDQGSNKKTLASSLVELKDQGKIDGMLAEWANHLRVIGNIGAHFTDKSVSAQDAEDALDFAEALIDHLYDLRPRFENFKARQSNAT